MVSNNQIVIAKILRSIQWPVTRFNYYLAYKNRSFKLAEYLLQWLKESVKTSAKDDRKYTGPALSKLGMDMAALTYLEV